MNWLIASIMLAILLLSPKQLLAVPFEQITSEKEISAVLSEIPVLDKDFAYKNIGERLENIGMKATFIMVYRITKKSEIELPDDRIGDVIYHIYTTDPPLALKSFACDMMGDPEFRKRGKRFIPESRTAIWLMTSKCETPQ